MILDVARMLQVWHVRGGQALPVLQGSMVWGRLPLGRFGTQVLFADLDGDGNDELVASAPFENQGRGAIAVMSPKVDENHRSSPPASPPSDA
ncbi:hypothetical protein T484DRAFT_1768544 [Baffinella frigidus]|nr:hypothetical protein T484DRAFT_1768544 [Cryptophyta sp. CCMP2293]